MAMPYVSDYLPKEVLHCRNNADKVLDWFRNLLD